MSDFSAAGLTDRAEPPRRRCVVCGELASRPALLRIVRRADGGLKLSPTAHGRGAYVHRSAACLDAAAASPKPLARSLRRTPPPELLRQIAAERSNLTAAARATAIP